MPQAIRRTRAKQTDANFDFRQISFYNLNSIEDCYAVFKLKPTCSFKVLREKYIRMSTHYHPRAGINWKTKHFIRVVLAYQCLERYHQERKKNGYIKREEFFRHWQQNHMTHDLDRACAYSRISRVLFERVLYPRFNKIRSINIKASITIIN
ncbi:MAG: J domain-containing protein [Bacteroidota bacterium]